jgi:hypothetical protein
VTLTSSRVRKYRPLLTEDTGVIPKKRVWLVAVIFCIEKVWGARYTLGARYLSKNTVVCNGSNLSKTFGELKVTVLLTNEQSRISIAMPKVENQNIKPVNI